ncbi:helix-turn-helix domain-containing protein [Streptomyces sp. NBC_00237]|uniref:PucR family transcriptional regulator n=1 Tax=Streptomyces sp. NBC_00237 TaxID=2975687 RepID=UPI0022588D48|nr:helix-turn-helix domain-containing protein [Streptomyces sp. NBC_00237]MCX5202949.1 helix-turn-helix domain-containing protein [Streptomyces sp. NBC_00237]
MTEREIPEEYVEGYAQTLREVAETGRRLDRDELDSRRALGERAAESGLGLRAVVRAYLTETREQWPRTASGSPDQVLAAVGQAVDAVAEGYERAQRMAVRQEEAVRREFIDDLLHGRSDLGRLAALAERFGLRFSRAHAVAVAEGPDAIEDGDAISRAVENSLTVRFADRRILVASKDGRLVCIAPGEQTDVLHHFAKQAHAAADDILVAVGRPHPGAGGVVHSYEEALGALSLAERMGLEGPVLHAADLLVFPVLGRDHQALVDLVRSALGPLEEARGGAEPLVATLREYFDAGCVAAEAARRLNLSVRALTYRLERIHRLTGADPSDPLRRYTLQTAVIGARMLDWPAREI